MDLLTALPIVLPFLTALLSALTRSDPRRSRRIGIVGAALHLVAALALLSAVLQHQVLALWVGSWPAPFGICLAADYLSAVMVVITATHPAAKPARLKTPRIAAMAPSPRLATRPRCTSRSYSWALGR